MLKHWLIWFFTLVSALLFVYLRETQATYFLLFAILTLPLIFGLFFLFFRCKITVTCALEPEQMTKGEHATYQLWLRNSSRLSAGIVRIQIQDGQGINSQSLRLQLGSRENRQLSIPIHGKYRGAHEIAVKSLNIYDALGLFSRRIKHATCSSTLLVTPKIYPIRHLPLAPLTRETNRPKLHGTGSDPTNVSDLRQYQQGDTFRQIHWKATAKRAELMSKNLQDTRHLSATLWIDAAIASGDAGLRLEREDALMDGVASVMQFCHKAGFSVALCSQNEQTAEFIEHFPLLYRKAAIFAFDSKKSLSDTLKNEKIHNMEPQNLLFFVQTVDKALCSLLLEMRERGCQVMVFYPTDTSRENISRLQHAGVYCMDCATLQKDGAR